MVERGVKMFLESDGKELEVLRSCFLEDVFNGAVKIRVFVPDNLLISVRNSGCEIAVRIVVNRISVGGTEDFMVTDHCFVLDGNNLVVDRFMKGQLLGQPIVPGIGLPVGSKRFKIRIEIGLVRIPKWTNRRFYVPWRADLKEIDVEGQIA